MINIVHCVMKLDENSSNSLNQTSKAIGKAPGSIGLDLNFFCSDFPLTIIKFKFGDVCRFFFTALIQRMLRKHQLLDNVTEKISGKDTATGV